MFRVPSVELIGKNANGRDVMIRFEIDDIPETDEAWITAALERGLPVDEEKTRGNIIVGQHNGFSGLIKSYDPLSTVLVAREVIRTCEKRHPEYKDALGTFMRKQEISVLDLDMRYVHSIGPVDSFYEIALHRGLTVRDHNIEDVLNAHINWEGVLKEVSGADEEYINTVSGVWYFCYEGKKR